MSRKKIGGPLVCIPAVQGDSSWRLCILAFQSSSSLLRSTVKHHDRCVMAYFCPFLHSKYTNTEVIYITVDFHHLENVLAGLCEGMWHENRCMFVHFCAHNAGVCMWSIVSRGQGGVGCSGSDEKQEYVASLCVGCLNRCLQAAVLHSSHSQGFVPGVEGHRVGGGRSGNWEC